LCASAARADCYGAAFKFIDDETDADMKAIPLGDAVGKHFDAGDESAAQRVVI
jgi:hypothetical protein